MKADDFAGEDAETLVFAVFVTGIEQQLQAEADAEEWFSAVYGGEDGIDEVFAAEFFNGVFEGPHAGQDDFIGGGDFGGFAGNDCLVADFFEAFLHAAEIAHAVVDDGDHGRGWVLGIRG